MNQSNELFGQGSGREVNIREFLHKYIRAWKWFVLSVIVFLSIGYIYIRAQVPQYVVHTDILIKDDKSASSGEKDFLQQLNLNSSSKVIDNEVQILRSNTLMEKVVGLLEIQNSYYIQNHISKIALYNNTGFKVDLLKENASSYVKPWTLKIINDKQAEFNEKAVPLNQPVETEAGLIIVIAKNAKADNTTILVNFNSVENVAQSYINNLKIDPATKESTVLTISIEDANIDRGKDVLNKLVEVYNQAGIEDKNVTTSNQLAFLKGRIDTLAVELGTVEKNVQVYKSANKITDISAESTAFLTAVQTNDAALSQLKMQMGTLNNLESYLNSPDNGSAKLPAMLGVTDPTMLALVQQLGEAQIRKETLLKSVPESNPLITSITDNIKVLKQTIAQTLQNLKSGLAITQRQLTAQGNVNDAIIRNVPTKERGLVDVMREQSIKNNLFTYLLQKREETALSLASTTPDSRTINRARASNIPIRPVKATLYLTFLLVGLFLPFSIVAGREALNVKVRKRADIKRYTDTPILADVSIAPADSEALVVAAKPRSMLAEQVRAFRSNLQYILPEPEQKVLLFTSSVSGEGKSFISLNLGASLASTGKRVIILELDLRKPKLNAALQIDNKIGLSNYLIGKADYKDLVKPIEKQENYSIITSGPNPPNPAELLLNGRIQILIEQLKKDYDYILLDAPPVGLVTDAHILAKWASATFYIVRYNYTLKSQIQLIDELKQMEVFKNMNIIFNAVDPDSGAYGYGYGYSYGYGYGYGYGYYSDDKPKKTFWQRLLKG